jgi:TolB-like protein
VSDIFISYAAADRERVRPLVTSLEAEGWSVWWDRHIGPGEVWDREIEDAVDSARCVIVIWSHASVSSDWVRAEAGEGMTRHRLAPVFIDNVRPPLLFRGIQSANLVGWPSSEGEHELRNLLLKIRRIVEGDEPQELGRGEQISVAVLPFANLSSDPEQEYLSDVLAEELFNLLARLPDLRVVARTSAFSYKGKEVTAQQIGRELNVSHLLEGSVRTAGQRLRFHVQFSRTDDGFTLWSESYDRTMGNIFDVQDEIAEAVANRLQVGLLGSAPSKRKIETEAYTLYLQANHLAQKATDDGSTKAINLFQRALEFDASYVDAWVGLSRMYLNEAARGQRPFEEGHRLAKSSLQTALAIDANDPVALCIMAGIQFDENDVVGAIEYLRAGLRSTIANDQCLNTAADILSCIGDHDRAIGLFRYLSQHDPVNASCFGNLANAHYLAGRWNEAFAALDVAESLSPNALGMNALRSITMVLRAEPGDLECALAFAEREQIDGFRLEALTIVHHSLADRTASDSALELLINDCGDEWPYNVARAFAYRGNIAAAFEWLQKARDTGDAGLAQARVDPLLSPLAVDVRWEPLLDSVGLSTSQLRNLKMDFEIPI